MLSLTVCSEKEFKCMEILGQQFKDIFKDGYELIYNIDISYISALRRCLRLYLLEKKKHRRTMYRRTLCMKRARFVQVLGLLSE